MTMRTKPSWLKVKLPIGKSYVAVKEIVSSHKLHTICQSGSCPNIGECWGNGTATFMILGNICTRSCKFCAVQTGKPDIVDVEEPMNVAKSIQLMKLKHCVVTSVDRDDLPDGGAEIWAQTVRAIKQLNPQTTIETLIPDFQGNKKLLNKIIEVKPDVVSHNLETGIRTTKLLRNQAIYERSLEVLRYLKENGIITKSGIMVGVGETDDEIYQVMDDLLKVKCDIMTIGQYLQPTKEHLPVERYVTPEQFDQYKKVGLEKGFKFFESAPLVRSSYHAEKHI
ncbi:MAG: lipoyl synthase [Bacteroidetes bacterium GWF2_33_38]|nr:MAG: lipoyl synthase [Bacteroidetes bacterium GWF2_33_38]OFY71424.1 MAG: lipoyl synthase [Bacteroidetes bacterium RIFOXYA12_FULL_33_9]OFY86066.1 MAG: lipoyl synthase [Bacteroidetes bacterium RIFOXYA2_FULL_33_7]